MFFSKKKNIYYYRRFLRIMSNCKKDDSLDKSLRRFMLIMPDYQKFFEIYYIRKRNRESRLRVRKIVKLQKSIINK